MEDITRLRICFKDNNILTKSQTSNGLKKSWLLIKSSHNNINNISDVSSHIINTFNLHLSCPYGIILTMDGFVLPPFESTSILKDKDEIGIKRKEMLLEITQGGKNLINSGKIVEKQQALLANIPLVANEEFEKESESEEQDEEEDDKNKHSKNDLYEEISPDGKKVSKKRKTSKNLGSSKKKKRKCTDLQSSEDDFQVDQNASNGFHLGESSDTKKKVSEVKKKHKSASVIVGMERNYDNSQPLPIPESKQQMRGWLAYVSMSAGKFFGSGLIQENAMECAVSAQTPDEAGKKPSRSARRKKAKKQGKRGAIKAEKEVLLSDSTCSLVGICNMQLEKMQSPEIDVRDNSVEQQQQIQSCKVDDEIASATEVVPIVIRPGHIRFVPLEEGELYEDGEAFQQRHVSAEIVQWNGISNKKKGQKWGKENSALWRDELQSWKKEYSVSMEIEEVKPPNNFIDFDKLEPLSRLPKEGDLIAYRLVELSSTWTPELTSFRVGETSWYNPVSDKILLAPLPEYPIAIEKFNEEDAFAQPSDTSFYKEDGLEVEFSSLVDVRMVKESDLDPGKATSGPPHATLMTNGDTSSVATPNGNGVYGSTSHSGKQENEWDEIKEILKAKKAELMRENSWMKENSAWSSRAMRRSALGPTMAMLRANNEI